MQCSNKALSLDVGSHVTSFNQLEYFFLAFHSYSHVYDIDGRPMWQQLPRGLGQSWKRERVPCKMQRDRRVLLGTSTTKTYFALSTVQTGYVKRNRIGQFNASIKCGKLKNCLSYCVLCSQLRRSEQAFNRTNENLGRLKCIISDTSVIG